MKTNIQCLLQTQIFKKGIEQCPLTFLNYLFIRSENGLEIQCVPTSAYTHNFHIHTLHSPKHNIHRYTLTHANSMYATPHTHYVYPSTFHIHTQSSRYKPHISHAQIHILQCTRVPPDTITYTLHTHTQPQIHTHTHTVITPILLSPEHSIHIYS